MGDVPKKQTKKSVSENKSQAICLVKGLAAAYAVTAIVFIAYALILTYTDVTEEHISLVVLLCTVISAVIAGFDSARGAKRRGLLWGMGAGICYILILFLIGFAEKGTFGFNMGKVSALLISIAGGGIGGILGINVKK